MPKPRVIYWFRTDLRLHDSPALKAALDLQPEAFWPIWTWDPHYVYRARVGVNRWQFLIDCQNDVSCQLTSLNPNSKLFLLREAPQTLLPKLFKAWKITHLVFEKDTDAYARDRDNTIIALAKEAGVEVITKTGRTLWDPDELVKKNGNKPTMSISQVQTAGPKVGKIPRPIPAPSLIPDPGETEMGFEQEQPVDRPDFNNGHRKEGKKDKSYEKISGPKGNFAVPTLLELGFPPATTPHRGGETVALSALSKIIDDGEYTATFEKPNTAPTAFSPQSTTLLSPHLHFGSLSIREFYWRVQDVVDSYNKEGKGGKKKASQPPVSLTGQLLFRDMYFGAQAALGYSFGQTYNNSHCRFIPWHLPTNIDPSTQLPSLLPDGKSYLIGPRSLEAETWFRRWTLGLTGFPWIDALMRQLRLEGWMHHLGRHAVACFLTRGGCYVSWERGAEVFEELLLDHETACNAGNWQWLSCTAFYAQFYRCYSPVAFPQKTDKNGDFVRRYVPALSKLPAKYIYEPWKAPVAELRKAGVSLMRDGEWEEGGGGEGTYPRPMFDFPARRTICMDGMKRAYSVGLYGDNPKVLDGSWRQLFNESDEGVDTRDVDPKGGKEADGAVEEDASGAAEEGGENKGGDGEELNGNDVSGKGAGTKRKTAPKAKGQGTLDGLVKRTKMKK